MMGKGINSFICIHSFNLSILVRIVVDPGNTGRTQEISQKIKHPRRSPCTHTFTIGGNSHFTYQHAVGRRWEQTGEPQREHTKTMLNLTQRDRHTRRRSGDCSKDKMSPQLTDVLSVNMLILDLQTIPSYRAMGPL